MEFEPLASGVYLEALGVDGDAIWFSDVIVGGVHRRLPDGAVAEWRSGVRWIGGILFNEDGAVISSGPGGIAWVNPLTGASGMLLDAIDGDPIGGVNEITPDGHGGLYFGTVDLPAIERGERPSPAALYRLDADRRLSKLHEGLKFSNGLGLSPDSRRLYHNESFVGLFAHDVTPDGRLGAPVMLLDKKDCDGLAIDRDGDIWITGFSSPEVLCVTPDGAIKQRIPVPGEAVTNLRFGGADGRDLYVTTVTTESAIAIARGKLPTDRTSMLYRGRVGVAGKPIARTRFRLG